MLSSLPQMLPPLSSPALSRLCASPNTAGQSPAVERGRDETGSQEGRVLGLATPTVHHVAEGNALGCHSVGVTPPFIFPPCTSAGRVTSTYRYVHSRAGGENFKPPTWNFQVRPTYQHVRPESAARISNRRPWCFQAFPSKSLFSSAPCSTVMKLKKTENDITKHEGIKLETAHP